MNNLEKLQSLCGGDFDALLLTSEANRFYATGVKTSAGVVLITGKSAAFLTDFRYMEAAQKQRGGFDVIIATRESGNSYEDTVKKLAQDSGVKRVGFEEDALTVGAYEKWRSALGRGVEWIPSQQTLYKARAVKAAWELERMKKAQRIAERAYGAVLSVMRQGMTEREVAAELTYHMLKNGASAMSFDPIVISGPNSSLPHGEPTDRPLQEGDFVIIDIGCVADGYCSDMTRTVAVGGADAEMRKVYGVVLDAQRTGISAARAGVKGADIHNAAARVIEEAGYGERFGHGFGHGIGIEVHESYGAHPRENRSLPAGAVITAEPGIYLPGRFGVRIEDCVVLREGGAENLTLAGKELQIIP